MRALNFLPLIVTHCLTSAIPTGDTGSNSCAPASAAALQNVKSKFTSAGLVPTYVTTFNPTLLANVVYTVATGGTETVDLGNTFNSTDTLIQPAVILTPEWGQPASTTYSVFFINFDNPNPKLPPSLHLPFLHWQESGLPACSSAAGNQVQLFIPSAPPSVAPDRYTFLIFREPPGYVPSAATTASRILLNVNSYAASQNLTLVGGNYFLEGQIDNVPSA